MDKDLASAVEVTGVLIDDPRIFATISVLDRVSGVQEQLQRVKQQFDRMRDDLSEDSQQKVDKSLKNNELASDTLQDHLIESLEQGAPHNHNQLETITYCLRKLGEQLDRVEKRLILRGSDPDGSRLQEAELVLDELNTKNQHLPGGVEPVN